MTNAIIDPKTRTLIQKNRDKINQSIKNKIKDNQ